MDSVQQPIWKTSKSVTRTLDLSLSRNEPYKPQIQTVTRDTDLRLKAFSTVVHAPLERSGLTSNREFESVQGLLKLAKQQQQTSNGSIEEKYMLPLKSILGATSRETVQTESRSIIIEEEKHGEDITPKAMSRMNLRLSLNKIIKTVPFKTTTSTAQTIESSSRNISSYRDVLQISSKTYFKSVQSDFKIRFKKGRTIKIDN